MIPVLLFGIISYGYTLINYITTSSLDAVWLVVSVISLFVSIFLILLNLPNKIKNTKFLLNLENKSNALFSYISIVILFLFGIALLLNCMITEFNLLGLIGGVAITLVFFYATYIVLLEKSTVVFEVQNKDVHENTKLYCVDLVNDEYGLIEYYTEDPSKLIREKSYSFVINKYTNRVIKVNNEVINID